MRAVAVWASWTAAALGAVWWVLLLTEPRLGTWFLPAGVDAGLIRTFVLADLAFFVAAPALAAVGLGRRARWGWGALCLHAGGVLYAALWGWGLVLETGEGWYGALLMTAPAVVFPSLAWRLRNDG